jgi:hypothetical protein
VLWFQQGRRKRGKRTEETLRLFFFLPLLSFDYYGQTTRRPIIKHTHTHQEKRRRPCVCPLSYLCDSLICVCVLYTRACSFYRFFASFLFYFFFLPVILFLSRRRNTSPSAGWMRRVSQRVKPTPTGSHVGVVSLPLVVVVV